MDLNIGLYIRITNNCNLTCTHCCYESGPGGHTMSPKDIESLVNNIDIDLARVEVTGGEPFTRPKIMHQLLGGLSRHKHTTTASLNISTNGMWVNGLDSTVKTLAELQQYGLDRIAITSKDPFHAEQGMDISKIDLSDKRSALSVALRTFREGLNGKSSFGMLSTGVYKPTPVGRARSLPRSRVAGKNLCCDKIYQDSMSYTINPQGDVYSCTYELIPPVGNIFRQSLSEIHENFLSTDIIRDIILETPRAVAKRLQVKPDRNYDCRTCMEIFDTFSV